MSFRRPGAATRVAAPGSGLKTPDSRLQTNADCPPTLIFACGNPSRGDDALGPSLLRALEQGCASGEFNGVELLTDFQLQIEHALDLVGRERVLFVDAAASGPAPFAFESVSPSRDLSYSSHAMSPAAVLATYEQVVGDRLPPVWLLAIRGYEFGLGKGLSDQASDNLERALVFVRGFLSASREKFGSEPVAVGAWT